MSQSSYEVLHGMESHLHCVALALITVLECILRPGLLIIQGSLVPGLLKYVLKNILCTDT